MDYGILLKRLLPELVLVITALVVLGADLTVWKRLPIGFRKTAACLVTSLGCFLAWLILGASAEVGTFYGGVWIAAPQVAFLKQTFLLLTVATAWITRESAFTRHVGEYFLLLLLSSVGLMGMVSTENLLLAFVSLELLSLSLYAMTAFSKEQSRSADAALNYFLVGGISTAMLLYGTSLLYGLTGEIHLTEMSHRLAARGADPLLLVALVLVAAGLGFKLAAVPFHLWAPDAYAGAPAPTAAFIASGSKVASVYLLAKWVMIGLQPAAGSGAWWAFVPGWIPILSLMGLASMIVGTVSALVQSGARRLLAYSAVANAGYLLVGLVSNQESGAQAVMYYAITYAVTTVGAFGVVAVVERATGSDQLDQFAGLSRRSPFLAGCLTCFMLSLAGIPPLAGFFGKFYLFAAALQSPGPSLSMLWLVGVALLTSCVALYYYLQILKRVYVAEAPEKAVKLSIGWATHLVLGGCALGVLLAGCFPGWILGHFPIGR